MSDVFYTPPAADLTDSPEQGNPFFTVSLPKLTVMLIVTSGLYGLYWCFKNWSMYKAHSGRSIWPLPRTIFGLLYIPSLFSKVNQLLKSQGKGGLPYWAALAVGMILLALTPHIFGFVTGLIQALRGESFTGFGILSMVLISIVPLGLQCLILRRVQSFMNLLNGDPEGRRNSAFTTWNNVWMIIGVIYWAGGLFIGASMNSTLH